MAVPLPAGAVPLPQGAVPLEAPTNPAPPLPAGATPLADSPGPVYTPPAKALDQKALRQLWLDAKGDPAVADLMAHVALNESAGRNDAKNSYKEGGKEYHVRGLWQISDIHGQGNYEDPMANALKAVELYNNRVSKRQSGLEDWFDSKDKGAYGGWGKNLTPAIEIQHAAQVTRENHTPLPPGAIPIHNKPKNEDPRLGNYNIAEAFAGHQDLPFMMFNAYVMDGFKPNGPHQMDALDLWKPKEAGGKGNPGAASALYGLNSPSVLDAYSKSGNPVLKAYGETLKNNSWMAGGATFLEEWFNPMAWAEGKSAGKIAGPIVGAAGKLPGVQSTIAKVMHMFSQYKDIVAAHGTAPRNQLAAVGQNMSHAEEQGHTAMMDVFAGFNEKEQHEIVRRQQHLDPVDFGTRNDAIDRAAKLKRDYTRDMTAAKLASGALKHNQITGVEGSGKTTLHHEGKKVGTFDTDPGTYHSLAHQYDHPYAAYNEIMQDIGAKNGGGTAASLKHQTYNDIDKAVAGPEHRDSYLKGDLDHADIFRNFMMTGGKRVAFEKGLRQLAQDHPDMVTSADKWTKAQYAANKQSGKYIALSDTGLSDQASPFLKNAFVSKPFYDFLTNGNSMSMILGKSLAERGYGNGIEKWANAYNQAYRSTIVANPGYHPVWNIAPNASAAAADRGGLAALNPLNAPKDLANSMANQMRAMLGTGATVSIALGHTPIVGGMARAGARTLDRMREGMEYPFLKNADAYQDALHTALAAGQKTADDYKMAHQFAKEATYDESRHYGAMAEMGAPRPALGGTAGKVYTRGEDGKFKPKWSSPNEAFDQMISRMDNWNREGTFGKRGEEAFANTLFHQLHGKGGIMEGDPYGAAWAVREALGNYRNINPENIMSKMIMFFPWLASNVPFWFKMLTKGPTFITAPTQASRTQRDVAGDPDAYKSDNPTLGISTYNPDSGEKREIPLPFKDTERFAQGAWDFANGHSDRAIQEVLGEFLSRAKPLIGTGVNLVGTHFDEKANPVGSFHGYTTMYDKNTPGDVNVQIAQSAAQQLAPLPAPFVARDIIQHGYDQSKLGQYIQEAAGMGYLSTKDADSFKRAASKADQDVEKQMVKLRARQAGPNPLPEEQRKTIEDKITDRYKKISEAIQQRIDLAKKASTLLPGAVPLPAGAVPLPAGATPL